MHWLQLRHDRTTVVQLPCDELKSRGGRIAFVTGLVKTYVFFTRNVGF